MKLTTFLIGYGDKNGNGRGIYRITVEDQQVSASLVFACPEKPGALIQIGDELLLSFKGQQDCGIYRFRLTRQNELSVPERFTLPCFITAWAPTSITGVLLASSFYDGVDVLLRVTGDPEIIDKNQHIYRQRSNDARQTRVHPHHICLLPDSTFVCSVDMGADYVSLLSVTPEQLSLVNETYIDAPLGDGPRILRIRRDKRFAYLLNEISNSICVFAIEQHNHSGVPHFREIQRLSALNTGSVVNSPAGFVLTEDEHYLLVTNRGEDSLVLYAVEPESGLLSECDRVKSASTPRDVTIFGSSVLVAAQTSNTVQLFAIERQQQRLRHVSDTNSVQSPVGFVISSV